MVKFKPFNATLMYAHKAKQCSCVPYDIIDTQQASGIIRTNPFSYLSVTHSEVLCPRSEPTSKRVYVEANVQLEDFVKANILYDDEETGFYIYKQDSYGHMQIGIVGLTNIDDYENGTIKKHELTTKERELDRTQHFYYCQANTEPIFLFHENNNILESLALEISQRHIPSIDFVDEMNVRHRIYPVYTKRILEQITEEFSKMDKIYIADGHHLFAASYEVRQMLRKENPDFTGEEAFNYSLCAIFPKSQLKIMPYNRLVTYLNHKKEEEILDLLKENFSISHADRFQKPTKAHEFIIYLKGAYYRLNLKNQILDADPINHLDVTLVQELILEPIFDIDNPRSCKYLEFHDDESLQNTLKNHNDSVFGIFMYPTRIEDVMKVSDKNQIMPPKSTWFEPKLRSGLFLHRF